jgi:hypothetical protein
MDPRKSNPKANSAQGIAHSLAKVFPLHGDIAQGFHIPKTHGIAHGLSLG